MTFKRSIRDYIRQYFLGFKFQGNAHTRFGNKVGESLEINNFKKFTKEEQEFLKTITRYDEFEVEVRLEMDGFYVKGFIDTISYDKLFMADYKTGTMDKESEYDNPDYKQLHVYAAWVLQKYGIIPECCVILIGKKGSGRRGSPLRLSLESKTIPINVDQASIDKTKVFIQETAEEISALYKQYLKMTKEL